MRKTMLTSISALAIAFSLPAMADNSATGDNQVQEPAAQIQIEEQIEENLPTSEDLNAAANAAEPATSDMEPPQPVNPVAQMPADNLLGRNVMTTDGESAGDVDDLLLNKENQVTHVVVGVGGFLGFGEKPVSLPVQELALAGEKTLAVNMTLDQVKELPKFDSKVQ